MKEAPGTKASPIKGPAQTCKTTVSRADILLFSAKCFFRSPPPSPKRKPGPKGGRGGSPHACGWSTAEPGAPHPSLSPPRADTPKSVAGGSPGAERCRTAARHRLLSLQGGSLHLFPSLSPEKSAKFNN